MSTPDSLDLLPSMLCIDRLDRLRFLLEMLVRAGRAGIDEVRMFSIGLKPLNDHILVRLFLTFKVWSISVKLPVVWMSHVRFVVLYPLLLVHLSL